MIYLIEKAWWDPMENRKDFGYKVVGYADSEAAARLIVDRGGLLKGDETWSLSITHKEPPPLYRYKTLSKVDALAKILP